MQNIICLVHCLCAHFHNNRIRNIDIVRAARTHYNIACPEASLVCADAFWSALATIRSVRSMKIWLRQFNAYYSDQTGKCTGTSEIIVFFTPLADIMIDQMVMRQKAVSIPVYGGCGRSA